MSKRANRGTCTEPSVGQLLNQALVQDRHDQQFTDFSVTVDEAEFQCHRLVLSTRSGFFRSLITSGMKETREGRATIHKMSSDVFAIVLKWMYEGWAISAQENVINVLYAADLLDVQSLVSECKYILTQSLSPDNCVTFHQVSKVFSDKGLEQKSWEFLLNKFDCVSTTEEFYKLNTGELLSLVSDSHLDTRSEDMVIESILRWVHFEAGSMSDGHQIVKCEEQEEDGMHHFSIHSKDEDKGVAILQENGSTSQTVSRANPERTDTAEHDIPCESSTSAATEGLTKPADCVDAENYSHLSRRGKRLADLLEATRYLLVSGNCVWQTLACDPLVQADRRCRAIQEEILRYKARLDCHQSAVLSAAEHRWPGYLRDVLMSHTDGKLYYINLRRSRDWQELQLDCPLQNIKSLVYFDSNLYITDEKKRVYVYTPINMKWAELAPATQENVNTVSMLPVGNELVAVFKSGTDSYTVERLSIEFLGPAHWVQVGEFSTRGMEVASVTNIGSKLIIFWRQAGQNCLRMECFDLIQSKSFLLPDHLTSTSGLVTFKHGDEAFALQGNGSLWRISVSHRPPYLSLKHELCLWNFHRAVGGAMLVRGGLMVFETTTTESGGNPEPQAEKEVSLENVFREVTFIKSSPAQKSYVHSVLYLKPINLSRQRLGQ